MFFSEASSICGKEPSVFVRLSARCHDRVRDSTLLSLQSGLGVHQVICSGLVSILTELVELQELGPADI